MKKLLTVMALVMPLYLFAQNVTPEKVTKYETLLSKTGAVISSLQYDLGIIALESPYSDLTYGLSFSVSKVSVGNSTSKFLRITHYELNSKDNSEAFIEYSDVKQLDNAISQLIELSQKSVPEGCKVQNTYMTTDGLILISEEGKWTLKLERFTRDKITFKNIDALSGRLKEAIKKMDSM